MTINCKPKLEDFDEFLRLHAVMVLEAAKKRVPHDRGQVLWNTQFAFMHHVGEHPTLIPVLMSRLRTAEDKLEQVREWFERTGGTIGTGAGANYLNGDDDVGKRRADGKDGWDDLKAILS